ncbi:MAG: glutamine amidotransferase [Chlorobiaceae bacterium]|nr:glutamine amidotransferase [Chlorobiaceae bacterium]
MKKLFIIKAGSTFDSLLEPLGDFEEWVEKGLCMPPMRIQVVDAARGGQLPGADLCSGVVVTGSHAMVTDDLPWSLGIERWIPGLLNEAVPFLGICYGHQLLGRATGGTVGYHPLGREVGTVTVDLNDEANGDELFRGIPKCFHAHATHAQSVLQLPPGSVLLGGNGHEAHHAFRIGRCAWGVQFHPEYTAAVMRGYIEEQRRGLEAAGKDVEGMIAGVVECPDAATLLRNFASLASRAF